MMMMMMIYMYGLERMVWMEFDDLFILARAGRWRVLLLVAKNGN
ncbi:hypothetical protein H4I95_07527 [Botrytis cinerea]